MATPQDLSLNAVSVKKEGQEQNVEEKLPPKYEILTEVRGDKALAEKELSEESKRLWKPTEEDSILIEQLKRDYPALDHDMAETMYMFCKSYPEKTQKMVEMGDDYPWEYHKDEYYCEPIKHGQKFIGDKYCKVEHNAVDVAIRERLNLETGKMEFVHEDDPNMACITLGELMDYRAEQEEKAKLEAEKQERMTCVEHLENICEENVLKRTSSEVK